jgi:chromosome segregation ATPase
MSFAATFQAMIAKAVPPRSEVDAIVASVVKAPEIIAAEREFAENAAARQAAAKRLAEIFERLNFKSPVRRTLFAQEQNQLEAERADLNRKVSELTANARRLQSQIANLTPAYARCVAAALVEFRSRAAEQLLDSVSAAEAALDDLRQSNKALMAVGMTPAGAFAMPYAEALKGLATKVLNESFS